MTKVSMTKMTETLESIRKICTSIRTDIPKVELTSHLRTDLRFDSIDTLAFFNEVEDTFGVSVPLQAIQALKTLSVQEIVGLIQRLKGGST